ncbi:hypothetical protein [Streptomyces griseorubiginosus]|uniref:hypothetical protein n=1 Tax=Streptomyces griseorubiginosus TaxID=67304 RepID=UPI00331B9484
MAAYRRRHITVAAAVTLTLALIAAFATGCKAEDSLDCLSNADSIADSVAAMRKAGADAIENPARTEESIITIAKNLDTINETTDDSKVDNAVDDLRRAITDYNKAILSGDTRPDSSKIDTAADELQNLCTP